MAGLAATDRGTAVGYGCSSGPLRDLAVLRRFLAGPSLIPLPRPISGARGQWRMGAQWGLRRVWWAVRELRLRLSGDDCSADPLTAALRSDRSLRPSALPQTSRPLHSTNHAKHTTTQPSHTHIIDHLNERTERR